MPSTYPFQHLVFPRVKYLFLFVCSGTSPQENSFTPQVFPGCLRLPSLSSDVSGLLSVWSLETWLCSDLEVRSSAQYTALVVGSPFIITQKSLPPFPVVGSQVILSLKLVQVLGVALVTSQGTWEVPFLRPFVSGSVYPSTLTCGQEDSSRVDILFLRNLKALLD